MRDTFQQNSLVNNKYLETIKAYNGEIFHLSYHQERLEKTIGHKDIELSEVLNPPQEGLYRCRAIYDTYSVSVTYYPYVKRNICKLKLISDDTIDYDKKYADRSEIEKLLEQKDGCDDIIIVKNGFITDTSIANIALKQGSEWFTPQAPLLYGTTRKRLLEEKKLKTRDIRVEELTEYSEIALMNAMIDFDIIAVENIREIIC